MCWLFVNVPRMLQGDLVIILKVLVMLMDLRMEQMKRNLCNLDPRFDNLEIPLLNAHLTTERDLALVLRKHILVFLRKKTFSKMETQDVKRRIRGKDPSTRQEMIAIAHELEMNIIALEAEMRKCEETPPPRSTDPCTNEAPHHVSAEVGGDTRTKRPMADRLWERVLLKDRLGSRVGEPSAPENRRCHRCQKEGHIVRNCPNPREAEPILPASTKVDPLAGHRTKDVICLGCKKERHTLAQCWK